MDSQHKEKMNKGDDKRSLVFPATLITLLGSLAFISGSQSSDIKGKLHQDVLLPCIVNYKDEFDYFSLVLSWQRPANDNDTMVHSFYYNASHPDHQAAQYRGRTQIFYESLPDGNASLLLKNLTEPDAGNYICYVLLNQTRGFHTQTLNLTVEDEPVAETKYRIRIFIVVSLISVILTLTAFLLHCCWRRHGLRPKDEESAPLNEDNPDPINEYRKTFTKSKYQDIYERHFIVKGNNFTTFQSDVRFGNKQKTIKVKELFTPENKPFMSKRMLLVGAAGTGKSYFCKWLEQGWAKGKITLYQCIIYVSMKKIETEKDKTSVNKIVEKKSKGLSEVLDLAGALLILDELDDLVYDTSVMDNNSTQKDNNTDLPLNTLIASIINKQLLPETDVLIVARHDLPIHKVPTNCTSTFVLQEFNDIEAHNVYDNAGTISADMYKSIKYISSIPAFFIMMCKFNRYSEKLQGFTSPYEMLVSVLQQYLVQNDGGHVEHTIRQWAKQSYLNLVSGEQKRSLSTGKFDDFLEFFTCNSTMEYHCAFLKDMLAALHCVWELKPDKSLNECLDFWLFGAPKTGNPICPLLLPVVKEHHAKYYHFIRFFMRLLPYPDYKSLCTNTQNMDDNIRQILRKYLNNILHEKSESSKDYEKLAMVHCVFELHDDRVTVELSSIKHFSLLNTPLNSLDIRALVYCFKDVKLHKLDLRLCSLTDQNVEQLKNVIKNTEYVLLSFNRLTSKTGTFLKELLQDSQCLMKKLALGTNNLGPYGAQALWRALEHNTSLESLYLYDNDIGDDGTTGMVEHLENNNSLKELHLCLNDFGEEATRNITNLKAKKTELKVVVTISEDLELFEYTERKIEGLSSIWEDFNPDWLLKLLEAVHTDLQNTQWGMDEALDQERRKKLIEQIRSTMALIQMGSIGRRGNIQHHLQQLITLSRQPRSMTHSFSSMLDQEWRQELFSV